MRLHVALRSFVLVSFAAACSRPAKEEPAAARTAPETSVTRATVTTATASASASAAPARASASAAASAGPGRATVYRWSDPVTLTGTLIEKEVLSAKGGSLETTFLKLDRPISVHDKPGEQFGSYDGESELWYAGESKDASRLIGKRVTFKGSLNPMQTGHHHSNVWLTGDLAPAAP
jgi:hypothetical protein